MNDEVKVAEARGVLAPEQAAGMDEFVQLILSLRDRRPLELEETRIILAGMEVPRQVCQAGDQPAATVGDGDWSYCYSQPLVAGDTLNLSRQGSVPIACYFQMDETGTPLGLFLLQAGLVENSQILTCNLTKLKDGWNLWKESGGRQATFHLAILPDEAVPWDLAPLGYLYGQIRALEEERREKPAQEPISPVTPAPTPVPQPVIPMPAVSAGPKFCGRCGSALNPGVRFCGVCGTPVEVAKGADPAQFCLVRQPDGRIYRLKAHMTLGREADNDIQFEQDGQVSRHHAVLEWVGGAWQITDLRSSNGVKINGTRITAPVTLKAGDDICLGGTHLTLKMD